MFIIVVGLGRYVLGRFKSATYHKIPNVYGRSGGVVGVVGSFCNLLFLLNFVFISSLKENK